MKKTSQQHTWLFAVSLFSFSPHAAIEVHGHRGARARFPENTLPAFQYAISAGADMLELDLGITKDGKVIISHNFNIDPVLCRDKDGKPPKADLAIYSLTLAQVKEFDCGSVQNPNFKTQTPVPGTKIPTLDELFTMVKNSTDPHAKTVGFNIETKEPSHYVGSKKFAEIAIAKIKEYGMLDRSVLQSFDFEVLREARKIEPKLRLSALVERWNQNSVAIAKEYKVEILSPIYVFLNPKTVKELHAMGVKVLPWTADNQMEWARLAQMDVDGIISDDPEGLIAYLKKKGLR